MSATLGNGNITFGDATVQSTAGSMLGVGQSWTNVTASRAFGTTYTNSTGKPLYVFVTGTAYRSGQAYGTGAFYVGGVQIGTCQAPAVYWNTVWLKFIVPIGATYSVAQTNNIFEMGQWTELR